MEKNYTKETKTFLSCDGVHQISYTVYTPNQPPHAIVQIAHGMAEHFGRYEDFAGFLASKGIVVCGNDHLGHGASVKDESELGFFAEKSGADLVISDMRVLHGILREKYRKLPYILFGHSMGSFLARLYTTRFGNELDGVIYCGTSAGKEPLWLGKTIATLFCCLFGKKHRSPLLRKLSMGGYNKRFVGQPGNWLTKDTAIVKQYQDDPRMGFAFTCSGYRDLFSLLSRISSDTWAKTVRRSLPVLIVSGSDDPVGGFGEGVRTVYDRLRDAEITDLTLKLYAGDRHEILNELDRNVVYEDLYAWVEEVCRGVFAANGAHR